MLGVRRDRAENTIVATSQLRLTGFTASPRALRIGTTNFGQAWGRSSFFGLGNRCCSATCASDD